MKLTEICIQKPVLAWMLMAATVVFGAVAITRIGISQLPDVDFPNINIGVSWSGAAPESVEHDVVEPIEEAVVQVEGVRSVTSSCRQGGANITVELDLERDVDLALQDVQAKVAQAQSRLPRDIDPPVISKSNPEDQPIMWIGLSGAFPQQLISDTARYVVKEKLQTVPGVGEVMMGGYLERNVRIWVDATRLDERDLTVADVQRALQREHVELPAGQLQAEGREVNVRVFGEALDLAALRKIVVREQQGAPVYLEDVALVEDGFEDVRRFSRVNGQPAQGLGVKKQRGSNAVAVAQGVRKALDEIRPTLPAGMDLGVNFDTTSFIEDSVHEIEWELMLSVILTALVCWLFLGSFSSTLNVILAIPMSLLGTIATIYFLGYTLNTFTLLALALSVGIVVDDAIMVLENIFRHAESGKDRVRAAREGTAEITFAALAATIAVVAIFIPVTFMSGVVGKFFMQFGVTLSVAVLLSYVEAVTLAPARCSQLLDVSREHRGRMGRAVDRAFAGLASLYGRMLTRGLRHPILVLLLALVVFAGSIGTFAALPKEFAPSQDQSRILTRLTTAVGSDLPETDRLFRRAEAFVRAQPEVERSFAVVGGFGGSGVNSGMMFITLKDPKQRKKTQAQFAATLRKELNNYPGLKAIVQDLSQAGFGGGRGFPMEFAIQGPDFDQLVATSDEVNQKLRASGTVVDLDTNYEIGMPELRIIPDRARAADLGVSIEEVASTISTLVGGIRVGKYSSGGRRIDVRLKLLADQRSRPSDLGRLRVRNRDGQLIPLSTLVRTEERPTLQAITRRDRERAISHFANIAPGHTQDQAAAALTQVAKELPPGYRLVNVGQSMQFKETMSGLIFALLLGILVSYMVLASQFNSLLHPITVLTILPLSAAGAAFGLWLAGSSINMFSMIGFLLLMGLAKKNSIILVDYANQLRADGKDSLTAMLEAGPVRLRPILMTSVATVMAAVPAALSLGPGGEIRAPMAIAVIGGMAVSTALSLFVVPAFYVATDHGLLRVKKLGSLFKPRATKQSVEPSAQ